jgi:hypothetical protein
MLLRLQFEDRQGSVVLTGQSYVPNRNRNRLDISLIVKVIRGGRTRRISIHRVFDLPFEVERRHPIHLQDKWSESDDEWDDISDSEDSSESDAADGPDNAVLAQNAVPAQQNGLHGPRNGPDNAVPAQQNGLDGP